jgi:hypothetical protein
MAMHNRSSAPVGRASGGWAFTALMALVVVALFSVPCLAQDKITMWGTPPREKPHMTKAGEGFPPLPLPAVPQRRSEKKRPPAPPMLIGNVSNFSFEGWQGSPGAVDTLLGNARGRLNLWYGWEQVDIRTLAREFTSGVTRRTPILYLCAYYPLNLSNDQRSALREYVAAGGTLLINACGQDAAFAAAEKELEQMFPKVPLRTLPPDHPVYHSYFDMTTVSYPTPSTNALDAGASTKGPPRLKAISLGTRAAVIVSLEDLACGWNQWNNPTVRRVAAEDSTKLGLNIITYATAENRLAKFLAKTIDVTGPSVRPRQQLTLTQIVHDGNWDPNPSAVPLFIKDLASNTSIAVQFERTPMPLKDPKLFEQPLLLMSGTWDPNLKDDEIALLRRYLTNGGVLLAESASGRVEFDVAFRELCTKLFPTTALAPLPSDHPLFTAFYKIDTVQVNHENEPVKPQIEAVMAGDKPVILYSRFGLSDGWAHQHSAYAKAYASADALKLGTNLVVYLMNP